MTVDAHTIWEVRANGALARAGGYAWVSLANSTYKWTASGSGTNEYYVELAGGGGPSLTEPKSVTTDGTYKLDTNGTLGSLNAGEWDWGDNDTLGYSTVYVRLDDGTDPDTKNEKFVSMGKGGGIDYSQQDAREQGYTGTLECVIASTTLSLTSGTFDADIAGNFIKITGGTNFLTNEWFEVISRDTTTTVTLDRTACDGVGNGVAGTGNMGGALTFLDNPFEQFAPGHLAYVKNDGTYTLGSNFAVANDGTTVSPIRVIGYNTGRGDNPTGTDRPLVDGGANDIRFDDFWHVFNIRFETADSVGVDFDTGCLAQNCRFSNDSGSIFEATNIGKVTLLGCEATSSNGEGIVTSAADSKIIGCYVHDVTTGISIGTQSRHAIIGNIIDTCTTGILGTASAGFNALMTIYGNTFYNNTTNLSFNEGDQNAFLNNIFDAGTTGAIWTTRHASTYFDYNCWDNTTDVSNTSKGDNSVTGDPGLTAPASGDFTLGSGSNCLDAGLQVGVDVGAVGDYKVNIGADQDDVAAAGGGGTKMAGASGGMVG